MRTVRHVFGGLLALSALLLAGCGGGGGSSFAAAVPDAAGSAIPQQRQVVVQFDRNSDGFLDTVTVDATTEDLEIVAALDGVAGGATPLDVSPALKGSTLDPEIVLSLKTYLADSLEVASETRLDVVDSTGRSITLTIFE